MRDLFIVILKILKGYMWLVTFVYGYPQQPFKKQPWKDSYFLNNNSIDIWLIIGDYKELTGSWGKELNNKVTLRNMTNLTMLYITNLNKYWMKMVLWI